MHVHPYIHHPIHRNPEPMGILLLISAGTGFSTHALINLAVILYEDVE